MFHDHLGILGFHLANNENPVLAEEHVPSDSVRHHQTVFETSGTTTP